MQSTAVNFSTEDRFILAIAFQILVLFQLYCSYVSVNS